MNRTIPRKVYVLPKSLNTKDWSFQKFHCAHSIPKPSEIAAHKIQCSVSHLDWECCRQMMRAGVGTGTRPQPKGLFVKMCTSQKAHKIIFSFILWEGAGRAEQVGILLVLSSSKPGRAGLGSRHDSEPALTMMNFAIVITNSFQSDL